MRRILWITVGITAAWCLAEPAPARAGWTRASRGTVSGEFLELPADARASGMADAVTPVADDASAIYWNPAGLIQIDHMAVSLMDSSYVGDSKFGSASAGMKISKDLAGGISFRQMSYGSVQRTNTSGDDLGTFNPSEMAASGGVAWREDEHTVGAAVKYVESRLSDSASTYAADFGYRSRPFRDDRLTVGFAIRNVGGRLKYSQDSEKLPATVSGGMSFQARKDWLLVSEVELPADDQMALALAAENVQRLSNRAAVFFRAGFTTVSSRSTQGFALGMGASLSQLRIDYALNFEGNLNPANMFSMSYAF